MCQTPHQCTRWWWPAASRFELNKEEMCFNLSSGGQPQILCFSPTLTNILKKSLGHVSCSVEQSFPVYLDFMRKKSLKFSGLEHCSYAGSSGKEFQNQARPYHQKGDDRCHEGKTQANRRSILHVLALSELSPTQTWKRSKSLSHSNQSGRNLLTIWNLPSHDANYAFQGQASNLHWRFKAPFRLESENWRVSMYGISQEDEASVVFRRAARTAQSWPWSFETKIKSTKTSQDWRKLYRNIIWKMKHTKRKRWHRPATML